MPNWYQVGQGLTIILIGVSAYMLAANSLSSSDIPGGIIGYNQQLEDLNSSVVVLTEQLDNLDQELAPPNISISSILIIPFAFIGTAVAAANMVLILSFNLLTGWTFLINLLFEPFGLGVLGYVLITIFGAVEAWFVFRAIIIIASVIRGGGGGGG